MIRWSLSNDVAEQVLRFHDGAVKAAIFLRDGASPPAGRTRVSRSGRRASRSRRRCSRGMRLRWSRLRCRLMAARSPRRPESDSEAKAWFTAFEEGLQKLFVRAPAVVACSRSVWHEIIDTVIEGPARTAADEIAEYLARHPIRFITDVAD